MARIIMLALPDRCLELGLPVGADTTRHHSRVQASSWHPGQDLSPGTGKHRWVDGGMYLHMAWVKTR
jgi:hypothetical protein